MRADFNGVARMYRWLEYATLGPLLERTRQQFLPSLDACRRALVLGDGDGRFTAKLMARNAAVRVHAVDQSCNMLRLLRHRCAAATLSPSRLRVTCADVSEVLPPSRDTDLVVTHFLLDCLTQAETEQLIARTGRSLRGGTLWLISEFRTPHRPARIYVRGLYLAFQLLTGLQVTQLPDYAPALHRAGFVLETERQRLFGMLTSQLWRKREGAANPRRL